MSVQVDHKVARRYSAALFAAAKKLGVTERVEGDLAQLVQLFADAPVLPNMLVSPAVPASRKHTLIDELLADLSDVTRVFLHVLVEKRREDVVVAVREDFERLADEERGVLRATARVASELDPKDLADLVAGLQRRTGKDVDLTVQVDPAILGGISVRMYDTVLDSTLRGALEGLREKMGLEV